MKDRNMKVKDAPDGLIYIFDVRTVGRGNAFIKISDQSQEEGYYLLDTCGMKMYGAANFTCEPIEIYRKNDSYYVKTVEYRKDLPKVNK